MRVKFSSLCVVLLFDLLLPTVAQALSVSVSNASAQPGATGVAVTINVDNATGIAGGDLTLTYSSAALTAKSAAGTSLLTSAGITLVPNLNTAGEVRMSLAGANGISSGSGALITITFEVNGTATPDDYELKLTRAVFRDDQAQVIPTNSNTSGTFTVKGSTPPPPAGIAISASDAQAKQGAMGVAVTINVDNATGIAGGDLTLTYSSTVLTAKSVAATSLVTSAGITLIPNLNTAGEVRMSLAGANGISSGSGALITITFEVNGTATPGSYELKLTQTVLRNDQEQVIPINSNTSGTFTVFQPRPGISVSVSNAQATPGTANVAITIDVDNAKGIAGGDLALTYNADELTATGVARGPLLLSSGIALVPNLNTTGEVRMSLAGTQEISSDSGTLIVLGFGVNGSATPGNYELKVTRAVFRDDQAQVIPTDSNTSGTFIVQAPKPKIDLPDQGPNFGNVVRVGHAGEQTFEIKNIGTGNLVVTAIRVDDSSFSAQPVNATFPVTIPAGQSHGIKVFFQPLVSGDHHATLTISSNDAENSGATLSIRATAPPGENPPVADFSPSDTTGVSPLTVQFTDTSTNSPMSWAWSFGDDSTSTQQNPTHIYQNPGNYTVKLEASNPAGNSSKTGTIHVISKTPVADFSATPTTGEDSLGVQFADMSQNDPTSWLWDFGDGFSSNEKDPKHTYRQGAFDVTLTATNAAGSNTITKKSLISVTGSIKVAADIQCNAGDGKLSNTKSVSAGSGDKIVIEVFATGYNNAQGVEITLSVPDISAISGKPQGASPEFPAVINTIEGNQLKMSAVVLGAPKSYSGALQLVGTMTLTLSSTFDSTIVTVTEVNFGTGLVKSDINLNVALGSPRVRFADKNGDPVYIILLVGATPFTEDFEDFIAFVGSFPSKKGDPHYNVQCDTNDDDTINFPDFINFASAFGQNAATRNSQPVPVTKP